MKKSYYYLLLILLITCQPEKKESLSWPEISQENKPWTRWWWHGSDVSPEGISAELKAYKEAGIGGMEITPIYGIRGEEEAFVSYLSEKWMDLFSFCLQEAQKQEMGIDMASGTGWPFGGPNISEKEASKYLTYKTYELEEGESLSEPLSYIQESFVRAVNRRDIKAENLKEPISENENLQALAIDQLRFKKSLPLISLMAYNKEEGKLALNDKVDQEGRLDWIAPEGKWTLYAVFQGMHGKMVERAAPGGEGLVIDHFSAHAIKHYLKKFDQSFEKHSIDGLRAFFNDSYEVDDARGQSNYSPKLMEEFKKRKGYELQNHWPELFGKAEDENHRRVLSDYREVISDLLLETFTKEWDAWAAGKNKIIRNQAHGSPANILDLYAASDIPETEGTDLVRIKFASSAGHISGKKLISAEAATWLDEHFLSNMADLKENLDRYLLGGVNHIFYHGSAYSPPGDPWPGRLFYAAIHANPRNSLWPAFKSLNAYVARTQSFLQQGLPANDVLLYLPAYDRFASPTRELLDHFDGHGAELEKSAFKSVADELLKLGYAFDYISDKQILQLKSQDSQLLSFGSKYKVILIPQTEFMPVKTLEKLLDFSQKGSRIIFLKNFPQSVPGMNNLQLRMETFEELLAQAKSEASSIQIGEEMRNLLEAAGVQREAMLDQGLNYSRRMLGDKYVYFISNWSNKEVDSWVPLTYPAKTLAIFDPMSGEYGKAKIRPGKEGELEVYLQLKEGESCILLLSPGEWDALDWKYYQKSGEDIPLEGKWKVSFVKGGPELPPAYETDKLSSWTEQEESVYKNFSGSANYTLRFSKPSTDFPYYLLDLGEVKETASIYLNGEKLADLLGPTYQVWIDAAKLKEENELKVIISNLMANRIAALDRAQVKWKKYYNINISARRAENRNEAGVFEASSWSVLPSGLLGPVKLKGGSLIKR